MNIRPRRNYLMKDSQNDTFSTKCPTLNKYFSVMTKNYVKPWKPQLALWLKTPYPAGFWIIPKTLWDILVWVASYLVPPNRGLRPWALVKKPHCYIFATTQQISNILVVLKSSDHVEQWFFIRLKWHTWNFQFSSNFFRVVMISFRKTKTASWGWLSLLKDEVSAVWAVLGKISSIYCQYCSDINRRNTPKNFKPTSGKVS